MWPFTKRPQPPIAPKVYAEADFDIEGKPVFSVERDTRRDITIIGHLMYPSGKPHEWFLPVSPQAHDALVRRFRIKLNLPLS